MFKDRALITAQKSISSALTQDRQLTLATASALRTREQSTDHEPRALSTVAALALSAHHWPQRARLAQATEMAAPRALFTGHSRIASAQHRPQDWPQRAFITGHRNGRSARSAQATKLTAARALSTGIRTGRSARAQYRQQDWPQRARSSQAT